MTETDRNTSGLAGDAADRVMRRLLRLSGPRLDAPSERAARVQRAVLAEWQSVVRRRKRRRRTVVASMALGAAALVVLAVTLDRPGSDERPSGAEIVASVERIDGPDVRRGETRLAPADTIRAGDRLDTGESGSVALRLRTGPALRVDRNTRLRLTSASRVDLDEGGIYIDSGSDGAPGIEIQTPLGLVRDVGTQFEVRLAPASLRVRVRSGLVELRRGDEIVPARPGVELAVGDTGIEIRRVATHGDDWSWTARLAPSLPIDGRPLAWFLERLCREHGWTLRYADASLAREASGIILHGSVEGLEAEEALSVVLATSDLTHRVLDGTLEVTRGGSGRIP